METKSHNTPKEPVITAPQKPFRRYSMKGTLASPSLLFSLILLCFGLLACQDPLARLGTQSETNPVINIVPLPPTNVGIDQIGDGTIIRLTWVDPNNMYAPTIRIRTTANDGGTVPASYSDTAKGVKVAVISGLTANRNYTFDLTSVDISGKESVATSVSCLSKPYKYRIKSAVQDGGIDAYLMNTYATNSLTTHDGVVAKDGDYNSAANYPVRVNCDIWIVMPALSNPLDRTIVSIMNVQETGKYLRIDSYSPTTAPTNGGGPHWYGWSLANIPAAAREYYTWIHLPSTITSAVPPRPLTDASFYLVAAKNGNATMKSIRLAAYSNRYLIWNNNHVLGLADNNASYSNNLASWTLVPQ